MDKKTFKADDKLEREPLAERLTTAITKFYPFTKEAYVLSLDARYGSGKTTFLKMWESYLKDKGHTVIYLDAWESDFDDEPLIPIISSLLNAIEIESKSKKSGAAIKSLVGAAALIGNSLVHKATGIDIKDTMATVEEDLENKDLIAQGKKIYEEFSHKKEAYEKLKKSLCEYVASLDKKPLIILVDELDRVRPNYAVQFLEAIKHIFSVQGICFVLAVHKGQLENSIKQLYGNIDFEDYYRRFVTRDVALPEVTHLKDISGFINQLADDYLDQKKNNGISFSFGSQQEAIVRTHAALVSRIFNLTPREIELLFRIYCQLMAVAPSNPKTHDPLISAPLTLIAAQIKNKEFYKGLGDGSLSPDEIAAYMNSLSFTGDYAKTESRNITLDTIAFSLTEEKKDAQNDAVLLIRQMYPSIPESMELATLSACIDQSPRAVFPNRRSIFQDVYKQLEDWRDFLDKT